MWWAVFEKWFEQKCVEPKNFKFRWTWRSDAGRRRKRLKSFATITKQYLVKDPEVIYRSHALTSFSTKKRPSKTWLVSISCSVELLWLKHCFECISDCRRFVWEEPFLPLHWTIYSEMWLVLAQNLYLYVFEWCDIGSLWPDTANRVWLCLYFSCHHVFILLLEFVCLEVIIWWGLQQFPLTVWFSYLFSCTTAKLDDDPFAAFSLKIRDYISQKTLHAIRNSSILMKHTQTLDTGIE